MRYQSTAATCGPSSLRTALLARGIARSEDELATLAKCTPTDGTRAQGILRALTLISREHPEIAPAVMHEKRADVAILRVLEALRSGTCVIMCVDGWSHWCVAFGLLGSTIHVSDPADEELVLHYRPEALLERWRGPNGRYYGILV